jgi:hypothetical protein
MGKRAERKLGAKTEERSWSLPSSTVAGPKWNVFPVPFWPGRPRSRSVTFDVQKRHPYTKTTSRLQLEASQHSSVAQWQSIRLLTGGL